MNCRNARELLFAFLDNELEAQANIEVQLHLEHCHECAREAEIEREVRRRLPVALGSRAGAVPDADAIRQTLARAVGTEPGVAATGRRVGAGTAAAVLLAAAMVIAGIWSWSRTGADRAKPTPLPFAAAGLVADFEHFLTAGKPLHLVTGNAAELSAWMGRELQGPIEVPVTKGPCRLLGARRCESFADPAAFALYEVAGAPAALVITRAPSGMQQGRSADHLHGHTILTCRQGDLAWAAVGRQTEEELSELLPRSGAGR
jgi:anti-sigma factor RsiW